ncbi:MAG: endonuclease III [Dehalococcoidaceae bacterium]|nr:endonuclease III [Dehalococcoidaceae bacterium]
MKNRISRIIILLDQEYPDARIALNYSNTLELLIATILSAQCTDVTVNKITPRLFARYHDAGQYAGAEIEELEQIIKPCGFYHAKARSIIGAAGIIYDKYQGRVPQTMAELVTLPGVARKTANVVLYNGYGVREGIAVDTHVKRLSRLLGLSRHNDPEKIENDLMEIVPREHWGHITYLLIEHGRRVCIARRPQCERCILAALCPSAYTVIRQARN